MKLICKNKKYSMKRWKFRWNIKNDEKPQVIVIREFLWKTRFPKHLKNLWKNKKGLIKRRIFQWNRKNNEKSEIIAKCVILLKNADFHIMFKICK